MWKVLKSLYLFPRDQQMIDIIILCLQNSLLFEVLHVYTPITLDSISTLSNEIMTRPTPRYFLMTASVIECTQPINSAKKWTGKYNCRHRAISLISWKLFHWFRENHVIASVSLKYRWTVHTIVLFHSNFSPSGEQPEHRKLAHAL